MRREIYNSPFETISHALAEANLLGRLGNRITDRFHAEYSARYVMEQLARHKDFLSPREVRCDPKISEATLTIAASILASEIQVRGEGVLASADRTARELLKALDETGLTLVLKKSVPL